MKKKAYVIVNEYPTEGIGGASCLFYSFEEDAIAEAMALAEELNFKNAALIRKRIEPLPMLKVVIML